MSRTSINANVTSAGHRDDNARSVHTSAFQATADPRATPIRMLRLPQVVEKTGLGKTTIYELQKLKLFPKSVPMTARSVRWIEAEIEAWMAQRANLRAPAAK